MMLLVKAGKLAAIRIDLVFDTSHLILRTLKELHEVTVVKGIFYRLWTKDTRGFLRFATYIKF